MGRKERKNNPDKIGAGRFLAWQSRGASMGAQVMIIAFITIYCTNTMGMPAALVGTLLMASKIFDGVTDLFAGYLVDRTNTRIGRGRPYELALIGSWITVWLMFSMPEGAALTVKAVWLFCMYTLNQSIFATLLNANTTVYMVRAFSSEQQYVKLNAFGGIIVTFVAVAVNMILPFTVASMATSAAGWSRMIAYFCIPLFIIGIMRFLFIKETNQVDISAGDKVNFREVLTVLGTNKYIYFVALLLFVYNMISNMGVSMYYYTYIVGDLTLMSITGIFSVVVLISMVFYPMLLKKMTARQLIQRGCIIFAVGQFIMFFAGGNIGMIIAAGLIGGVGSLPIAYMNYQLILDCASFNEWKGHARMEGTMTSITGFANKLGSAFGAGLLGILLSLSGFDGMQEVQPDSAIMMIRLLASLIPMAMYLVLAFVLKFYKLDDLMPQIKQDIEAKNAEGKEEA